MKFAIITAFALAVVASAYCPAAALGEAPKMQAIHVDKPPVIDGVLDDACWNRNPDAVEFWYAEAGVRAKESTKTWICYDEKNIYVAFHCYDSQPDKIAAQQKKRGGSLGTDDWVALEVDPWHAHRSIYWFDVNPCGTQLENLPGSGGTKIEWLGDWRANARIDSTGWTAEMAVPWSVFKYPKGQDTMGIYFIRRHSRSDQWWISPNLGPNYDSTLMYDWVGLKPPAPKLQTIALQYVNLGIGGVGFKTGLDVKRQLNQQTNALMTLNPDFDSIEQSVTSIDFTYSPLVLSDNRPFFSEGSNHQDREYRMFYSRSIEAVDVGLKVAGQTQNQDFSGLVTTSGSDDRHLLYKSKWNLGDYSNLGFAFVDTRRPGIENDVGSIYGQLGRRTDKRSDKIKYSLMKSWTPGSGGDGSITYAGAGGSGGPKQIGWGMWYQDVQPDYYAADGIVPDPDLKGWDYNLNYYDEYDKGYIRGWNVSMTGLDWHLHSGDLLNREIGISSEIWSLNSIYHIDVSKNSRRDEFPVDSGSFTVFQDLLYTLGYGWNQQDMYRRGWGDVSIGNRAGGKSFHTDLQQAFKIGRGFHSNISVEYLKMTGPFARRDRQTVASLSYDITRERSVSSRLVELNGTVNLTLGYRQAVRKGQDIYILFGEPNADRTVNRVIVKLIRPWF
jgi:hypothetical protein